MNNGLTDLNSKTTAKYTWTLNGCSCDVHFIKCGNIVQCTIIGNGSMSGNEWESSVIIPAQFRPINRCDIIARAYSGVSPNTEYGTTCYQIKDTGAIHISTRTLDGVYRDGSGTYIC